MEVEPTVEMCSKPYCKNPAAPGKLSCQKCIDYATAYYRAHKADRIAKTIERRKRRKLGVAVIRVEDQKKELKDEEEVRLEKAFTAALQADAEFWEAASRYVEACVNEPEGAVDGDLSRLAGRDGSEDRSVLPDGEAGGKDQLRVDQLRVRRPAGVEVQGADAAQVYRRGDRPESAGPEGV